MKSANVSVCKKEPTKPTNNISNGAKRGACRKGIRKPPKGFEDLHKMLFAQLYGK